MNLRLATLICCLLGTLQAHAQHLIIARKGHPSPYAIVLPDTTGNQAMDRFFRTGAQTIQTCIQEATGVQLPILKEAQHAPTTPAIFIGKTRAMTDNGFRTDAFTRWEHHIRAKGQNIFLFGQDLPSRPKASYPNHRHSFVLGSLRAVTVFLETFANTRFLAPGKSGIAVLPLEQVAVPQNYAYAKKPQIQYCLWGGQQELMYDLANNAFYPPWYGTYGGHSHDKAIPARKYFKAHPEYFALIRGKRTAHPTRPQYCLSHPQVQELIYQELVKHLKKGYDMVQLGQSDGFQPCQCDACKQLFGVDSWSEKLWILHRNLARRLQQEHPGKMVCIMAYGPTIRPPKTFSAFPDNVMIELAPYSPEGMKEWQKLHVKNGFVAYVYNWGVYHQEGFTPKRTRNFLAQQARNFNHSNIRGIYTCGNSDLYGLEGPVYFQWCRQLDNPTLDSEKLLQDYCRFAFDNAAHPMENFYRLLDERLKLDPRTATTDWNDPQLLDGLSPNTRSNLKLLALRYPPDTIQRLESHLAQAERRRPQTRTAQFLLPIVRLEFDYLKRTADVIHRMGTCASAPNAQSAQALLEAVQRRNDFIDTIPVQPRTKPPRAAIRQQLKLFSYHTIQDIREGGQLSAPLLAPFNWNVAWMKQHRILPVGRTIVADGTPQILVQKNFYSFQEDIIRDPTTIQCTWNHKGLTAILTFPKSTQKAVANDQIQLIIDDGNKRLWLTGRARNGKLGVHLRTKTSADNDGNGDQYKRLPKDTGQITAPADTKNNASVKIFIPWTCFDRPPNPGDQWHFNAIRESDKAGYIWEFNLMQKTWRNLRDAAGTILFN